MKEVWHSLLHADWYLLALAASINIVVIYLRSVRWTKLLEIQNYSFGVVEAFWSYLRSLYFGNVTPARLGELTRVHYVMKYVNINSAVATSGVIFDRVLDSYFILILGIISLFASEVWSHNIWIKASLLLAAVLIALFLFVPAVSLSIVRLVPNYKNIRDKAISWLQNFFEAINCFLTVKISFTIILTALIYLLFFIQCILLAYAMDLRIDAFYLILCVVIFSSLSILPISVSNMGTREALLIFMFSYVEIGREQAVTYSLLFFFIVNAFLAFSGWLVYVFYKDKEHKCISSNETVNNLCKEQTINKISN